MKVLPFLLVLVLQNVFCENFDKQNSKLLYPKKVPKKNLQILISRKFLNAKPVHLKSKKPTPVNKGYTVFPAVGSAEKKLFHVAESPYFPLDPMNEQKTRVKKVLPDYVISAVRKKRSAEANTTEVSQQLKNETKTDSKDKVEDQKPTKTRRVKSKKPKRSGRSKNKTRTKVKQKSKDHARNGKAIELKYTKRPVKRNRNKKNKNKPKGQKTRVEKTKKVKASRRLIASKDATIEDYPYVVSIQKNGEHWCAGALLNQRIVITTANCVWKASRVSRLQVRAGSRFVDHGGQEARIQEVFKHPLWSIRRNPDHDVALLLLDRTIKFSHKCHAVDLPNRIMLPAFEDAWVTSWGAERRDGVYDKKGVSMQVYHARLISRAKCNNVTQRFGVTVTDNFICLAQDGRRAPCTRDTGAPAVSDGVLWGLASWGLRKLCGTERFPAMFSYLASQDNMDFIINATKHLMGEERFYPFPDRYPIVQGKVGLPTRPDLPY